MTTALAQLPTGRELDEIRHRAIELRSLLDPEWRYTRARSLKSDGVVRFKRSEDPWVVRLTGFLREYSESTPETVHEVEDKYPDIVWAYHVFTMEERGPRYHLEALVLTGKDVEDLGTYLGVHPAVVLAYEQCFFDLRRHLVSEGAIRTYIRARSRARGLRDLDPDPFWKNVALSEGEELLYSLWDDGVLEETDRKKLDLLIESSARRNAMEAMRVRHIDARNAHEIIEEYVAICGNEMQRKKVEAEIGESVGFGQEFVAGLFHAVQFTVAPVARGSEKAFVELSSALAQAPALIARLQGAAMETEHVKIPESGGE